MASKDDKRPSVNENELSAHDLSDTEKKSAQNQDQQMTQGPPRRRDLWLWEIIGVVGSAAALAGIIGLVAALDGKPLPRWSQPHELNATFRGKQYGTSVAVSVNSVIAWLSTIGKLCVLIPISKGG